MRWDVRIERSLARLGTEVTLRRIRPSRAGGLVEIIEPVVLTAREASISDRPEPTLFFPEHEDFDGLARAFLEALERHGMVKPPSLEELLEPVRRHRDDAVAIRDRLLAIVEKRP